MLAGSALHHRAGDHRRRRHRPLRLLSTPESITSAERRQVLYGVTYWPADVGPYLWHEFVADRVAADLQAVASGGHQLVRVLLGWDAFMPSASSVNTRRLRDFERFLTVAEAASLRVVPVLFVQSIGDVVMLPPFAIDVANPRRGVRVVSEGVVQPGGPRDVYTDRAMIEAALRWGETMTSSFAGHGAVAWWDLAHDPATALRPRRITHLASWIHTVAQPFRDAGERSGVVLGTGDVVTARGVRLDVAFEGVDVAGVEVDVSRAALRGGTAAQRTAFLLQLAQRLGGADALHSHLVCCERDDDEPQGCMSEGEAHRYGADVVEIAVDHGCAGVHAAQWTRPGARMIETPPFDTRRDIARRGLVDEHGRATRFGASWMQQVANDREVQRAAPWPSQLDVDAYYANLPDSLHDLYAAWDEGDDNPAMLN